MTSLYNYSSPFFSPITGKLAVRQDLNPLSTGSIWIGDSQDNAIETLKLIDLRIDFNYFSQIFNELSSAKVILQSPTKRFPNAQSLSNLQSNSILKNLNGSLDIAIPNLDYLLPFLPRNHLFKGDDTGTAVPTLQIDKENLPSLSHNKIWAGDSNNVAQEVSLDFPSRDATFILKTSHSSMPNAQSLSDVTTYRSILGDSTLLKFSAGELKFAQPALTRVDYTADYVAPSLLGDIEDYILNHAKEMLKNIFVDTGSNLFTIFGIATTSLASLAYVSANYQTKLPSPPILSRYKYYDMADIAFDANHLQSHTNHEPGLMIRSWDSSAIVGSDLYPVSMGLFGYKNEIGYFPRIQGYCFRSEIENSSGHSNRYLPKNFELYEVAKDEGQIGWNHHMYRIFSFDKYSDTFSFDRKVSVNNHLHVSNDLNVTGSGSVEGNFGVTGVATLGETFINGAANLQSSATITGDVLLKSTTRIEGEVTVDNNIKITGDNNLILAVHSRDVEQNFNPGTIFIEDVN